MSAGTDLEYKTLTFVLAGGKGERLYPLTADQPKPVVPFGGVFRIIDFALSNVLNSGLRRIYVLTQYKQERLHSYVRDGWPLLCNEFRQEYGEDMRCLPPSSGKRYRGSADAVFQNLHLIEESRAEYVLVVSGDQVYHMNYGEILSRHAASGADLTMAAARYPIEQANSQGVIEADSSGRIIGFEEKPLSPRPRQSDPEEALVDMGVYVFAKDALVETLHRNADLNESADFTKDILPLLIRSNRAAVFQFGGYWRDVGTLDGYYQTNLDLLLSGAGFDPYENAAWPTRTLAGQVSLQRSRLASESRVSLDATLTACDIWMSIVSPGARIEANARLEAAIVLPGAHIGAGAKIRNAIVAEKAVVSPHAIIGYDFANDRAQFPVSENGIVIVGASEPEGPRALRQSRRSAKDHGSISLARSRGLPPREI